MLDMVIAVAKEAGNLLLDYYGNISVTYKEKSFHSADIVTKADLESEKHIYEALSKHFPNYNFYGEEEGLKDKNSEYTWYVDPLDGTGNFSRNIPLFGVSIGLVKNKQAILGVLYFPALDLLVYAQKGKGAFVNGNSTNVSTRDMSKSLYYAAGLYKGELTLYESIKNKCALVKIIDSSAYELAQIAMGDAELYILQNVPHDVVAGVCIVREAGGIVTDYDGTPWTLDAKGVVASNKVIHEEVIQNLQKENTPD